MGREGRKVLDEQGAEHEAGQRAEAADDRADEEQDRDRNREAERVDDLVLDRVEGAGDPRIDPAEREGEGLRPGEVDPARDRGDLAVADRAEGPPAAAT